MRGSEEGVESSELSPELMEEQENQQLYEVQTKLQNSKREYELITRVLEVSKFV